ncbi:MAG: hypothetical protein KIS66_16850 [Fimbriimonadaceae bacterium]|nr:hypothetical protein [Fimbriimonadaceae bacterium]
MSNIDRAALRRMLTNLADMADDATLTGKLRDAAQEAAKKYNTVLATLHAEADLPEGLFEPLPEDAGWDRLGVDARLLAGYLDDDRKGRHRHGPEDAPGDLGALVALAPFLNSDDLARLVEERIADGLPFDEGILIALAPFVGSDALGRMIRTRLRRGRSPGAVPVAPEAPKAPEAPHEPVAVVPPAPVRPPVPDPVDELEAEAARHVPPGPDLETLLTSLRDPYLDAGHRQEILDQIAVVMATKQD